MYLSIIDRMTSSTLEAFPHFEVDFQKSKLGDIDAPHLLSATLHPKIINTALGAAEVSINFQVQDDFLGTEECRFVMCLLVTY